MRLSQQEKEALSARLITMNQLKSLSEEKLMIIRKCDYDYLLAIICGDKKKDDAAFWALAARYEDR